MRKIKRDDEVVVIAGQVPDLDLRAGEGGEDQALDLGGGHGHAAVPVIFRPVPRGCKSCRRPWQGRCRPKA